MATPPDQDVPAYMIQYHNEYLNKGTVHLPAANIFEIDEDGIALNKSLIELVNEQVANNPYVSVSAYDPSMELMDMQNSLIDFSSTTGQLDPEEDWTDYTQTALDMYDNNFGDLEIDDLIEARYRRALKAMQIESSRFVAGMADINAVHSDAFVRGLGMMEGDLLASLKDEEIRLDFVDKQMKLDYITKAVANMTGQQGTELQSLQNVAAMTADNAKAAITANTNYYNQEMDIVTNEARWQLDGFGEIGAFLGAINGAPRISKLNQTPLQQFVTTAIPIAAMAGSAGAMIGGPIGGAAGAVAGLVGTGLYQLAGGIK